MDAERIQILIPTFNNVNDLDATMNSIWMQEYNLENVYVAIVDFGSDDGTYEKAIGYNKERLGVYSRPFEKNSRQRIADAARILSYVPPYVSSYVQVGGGNYCFSLILYPGDVMYPNCLRKLSGAYLEHYGLNPAMVVCESDILTEDGKILRQIPLFEKDRIIDGNKETQEYVTRGYKHQVFQMTHGFLKGTRRENYEQNEGRCWNKLVWRNYNRIAVYVREPLVCTKQIMYEDELQEILFRWEMCMSISFRWKGEYGSGKNEDMQSLLFENMAEYALWRSFCLYQKRVKWNDIEDCFYISGVIAPGIEEKKIYQDMKRLLEKKERSVEQAIESYFSGQY